MDTRVNLRQLFQRSSADRLAARALSQLYLALFLRGQTARGLTRTSAPGSIVSRLAVTLFFQALFGMFALLFVRQPVFTLAVAMHATNFVLLGVSVAGAAGTLLFDRNEGEILQHRPIAPAALLRAKVATLFKVSLWSAFSFNAVTLVVGMFAPDGGPAFLVAHALSIVLAALFTVSVVVLMYQLALRWTGRERVEGVITTLQVITVVTLIVGGQVLPRAMDRFDGIRLVVSVQHWWAWLLPPAWFAGFVEAVGGGGRTLGWALGAIALLATAVTSWLAFGVLVGGWHEGAQKLSESAGARRVTSRGRSPLQRLVHGPLRLWLRRDTDRAAFQLVVAYLLRNREMKLRFYPAMASLMALPIVTMITGDSDTKGVAFKLGIVSTYLGLTVLEGVQLVQHSEHWGAADLFRAAPVASPASLMTGARHAVMLLVFLPLALVFSTVALIVTGDVSVLALLAPGMILAPLFALIGSRGGVPLSRPPEDRSSSRLAVVLGTMFVAGALAVLAAFARARGVIGWLLLVETVLVGGLYWVLKRRLARAPWPSME